MICTDALERLFDDAAIAISLNLATNPAAAATVAAVAAATNPAMLVFGTDIPSTRAPRPFEAADIDLVETVLGTELARRVFWDNAPALYRVTA